MAITKKNALVTCIISIITASIAALSTYFATIEKAEQPSTEIIETPTSGTLEIGG